jgi:hypothetical protein
LPCAFPLSALDKNTMKPIHFISVLAAACGILFAADLPQSIDVQQRTKIEEYISSSGSYDPAAVAITGGTITGTTLGGLTYPSADGTTNQVLSANGNGVLTFKTVAAGAATTNATELTIGTLDAARLPATAAKTDVNNTFSGGTNGFNYITADRIKIGTGASNPSSYGLMVGRDNVGAPGTGAVCFGYGNAANGAYCFAGGKANTASGDYSWIWTGGNDGYGSVVTVNNAYLYSSIAYATNSVIGSYAIWAEGGTKIVGKNLQVGFGGLAFTNILSTSVLTNFGTVNAGTVTRVAIPLTGAKASDAAILGIPIEYPVASGSNLIFQCILTNNTALVDAINNTAVNVVCPDGTLRISAISY